MNVLKGQDILALGFMTFALFVGAGNIIFPPIVGLHSGPHVWMAALGFLITAVGLPVITVVALAKVGGAMDTLSHPIGRVAGGLLAAVCYLSVGPLFATPRTATVSFEVGLAPLTGDGPLPLFLYSLVYFAIVLVISLYPGKLLDTVGRFLAPLKIIALAALGIAAFMLPAGTIGQAEPSYEHAAFSQGFINGYLTMDTLGALVFGIVIVNAIRSRGVQSPRLIMAVDALVRTYDHVLLDAGTANDLPASLLTADARAVVAPDPSMSADARRVMSEQLKAVGFVDVTMLGAPATAEPVATEPRVVAA